MVDALYLLSHKEDDACACRKPKARDAGVCRARASAEFAPSFVSAIVMGCRAGASCWRRAQYWCAPVYGEGEMQRNSAEWPAPPDFIAESLAEAQTGS